MGQDKPGTTQQDQSSGIQERGACSQCAWLAEWHVWLLRMLILVVGMRGGACCLADWCIGSVLPYPLFDASNLNLMCRMVNRVLYCIILYCTVLQVE